MNPILLIVGLGALIVWVFSDTGKPDKNSAPQSADGGNSEPLNTEIDPDATETGIPESQPLTLEILREIFDGGARPLRRRDAVEILKAAPYYIPKTNAYRALAPSRRFAAHLREDENGWLNFVP